MQKLQLMQTNTSSQKPECPVEGPLKLWKATQKWPGESGVQQNKLRFSQRFHSQAQAVKEYLDHGPEAPAHSPFTPSWGGTKHAEQCNGKSIILEVVSLGSVRQINILKHEQPCKKWENFLFHTAIYQPSFSGQCTLNSAKLHSWLLVQGSVVYGWLHDHIEKTKQNTLGVIQYGPNTQQASNLETQQPGMGHRQDPFPSPTHLHTCTNAHTQR